MKPENNRLNTQQSNKSQSKNIFRMLAGAILSWVILMMMGIPAHVAHAVPFAVLIFVTTRGNHLVAGRVYGLPFIWMFLLFGFTLYPLSLLTAELIHLWVVPAEVEVRERMQHHGILWNMFTVAVELLMLQALTYWKTGKQDFGELV